MFAEVMSSAYSGGRMAFLSETASRITAWLLETCERRKSSSGQLPPYLARRLLWLYQTTSLTYLPAL